MPTPSYNPVPRRKDDRNTTDHSPSGKSYSELRQEKIDALKPITKAHAEEIRKMQQRSGTGSEEPLKTGDIVLNGYASPGFNDLHIIVGRTTIRGTKCYQTQPYFNGRLETRKSAFSIRDNKLTKIGHFDFRKAMQTAVVQARLKYEETL